MTTRLIRFHKPYGVLSQFTAEGKWQGLADYIDVPGVYVAGRLDADSEGLLLLTNDGALQARIADPRFKMEKTYWAQVEGIPSPAALAALEVFSNGTSTLAPAAYALQGYRYNRALMLPTVTRVTQAIVGEITVDEATTKITADMTEAVKQAEK